MKKTHYLLFTLTLLLVGTACSDDDTKLSEGKPIAFVDWDVNSIDCEWNLQKLNEVNFFVVNSEEDLAKFILCPATDKTEISGIDFSKQSLIILHELESAGIDEMTTKLIRYDDNTSVNKAKYKLTVLIANNATTMMESWTVAALTDKLTDVSAVGYLIERKWIYLGGRAKSPRGLSWTRSSTPIK